MEYDFANQSKLPLYFIFYDLNQKLVLSIVLYKTGL